MQKFFDRLRGARGFTNSPSSGDMTAEEIEVLVDLMNQLNPAEREIVVATANTLREAKDPSKQ